jgi:hypothetical protein
MADSSITLSRRRVLSLALVGAGLAGSCGATEMPRPILKFAVGEMSSQIDSQSTLKVRSGDYTGHGVEGRFFTTPHVLIYEDANLRLTIPDSGASVGRPTVLSMDEDQLTICTAPVLDAYSAIGPAVARAKALMTAIQQQGFGSPDGRYARFAHLTAYPSAGVRVPNAVGSWEEVEPYLLNPDYCIAEIIVFKLVKPALGIDCRLRNIRRAFPVGATNEVRAKELSVDDARRRQERVYDLEVSFSSDKLIS